MEYLKNCVSNEMNICFIKVIDLTDNEMAKVHLRHMVAGGRLYEGAAPEEVCQ
jgi:hypothetical protein